MRTLLILFFGLLLLQCSADQDLEKVLAMENASNDLQRGSYDNSGTPLNWPWRGINITSKDTIGVNENRIKEVKDLGVNTIRIVIDARTFSINYDLDIEEGIDQNLIWCENIIKWCAKEGIVVIIESLDYTHNQEKVNITSPEFWESEVALNEAINYIEELVIRLDKYENVVAYDFFSEPTAVSLDGVGVRPPNWYGFFDKLLQTVRNNSNKYVVFTPGAWGLPNGYHDFKTPIDDEKIIYGFHYYNPHTYTHQGINNWAGIFNYPDVINDKHWNENAIRNDIEYVSKWAKENDKLLYVGEFSVVRWAEGKEQYIEDVLNVFEENNISYTYWVLNEWVGWNMDYEPIEKNSTILNKTPEKTKTRQILENFWSKNNQ
ncbi:hypothetical protein GGR42_003129 [Saonia flava]|uniref:Glycoside hydrolase family 5 domain-containing protein n=1 Tax=Saonia flava TaxID=523696 RepID=A0A846QXG0_9FLAO|nr:cellulase family glycosylhydrolase [Saonia flava]NJB72638.1 hypothetical protein [Saonia flava]